MARCAKRRYRDRVAASLALAVIRRSDSSTRPTQECRAYFCAPCRGYHLTARA